MVNGARCVTASSGPYCPAASTLLLTFVLSSRLLKECRQSLPLTSPDSSRLVERLGKKLAIVSWQPCWAVRGDGAGGGGELAGRGREQSRMERGGSMGRQAGSAGSHAGGSVGANGQTTRVGQQPCCPYCLEGG